MSEPETVIVEKPALARVCWLLESKTGNTVRLRRHTPRRCQTACNALSGLVIVQLCVDGGGAGEVGAEGGWLGVHRGLRDVIDDATMNALFDQEAKLIY